MALTTQILLQISSNQTTTADFGTPTASIAKSYSLKLDNGTGANQADRLISKTRTIAASGTDDLDLSGTLTDVFGAVVSNVKIRAILVAAAAGNTNNVVVGAAASNAFVGPFGASTHTIAVAPGQFTFISNATLAGWGVTAGTGDLLRIANGGGTTTVTYDVFIWGTSA